MSNTMDDIFSAADSFLARKAKIRVVGVGGGGGNAINHMVEAGIENVDFISINTDAQDLGRNKAPFLVQVGERTTGGLGVGGDPKRGREAGEESIEKMKHIISGTDLLFITSGMGGGTGTGVAPILAKLAKETYGSNMLVVGVVTKPFNFEGLVRDRQAEEGIKEIQKYVDALIVVPNDKLLGAVDAKTPSKEAFKRVDDVLLQAVKGISDIITKPGEFNIDFNDVKKVMSDSGRALIGIGSAKGTGRHLAAIAQAITSPLLENADIMGAKGLVVHFLAGDDLTLHEQQEAMDYIRQYASSDSVIMFGHTYEGAPEDALKVTVIATGFPKDKKFFIPSKQAAINSLPGKAPAPLDPGLEEQDNMLIPAFLRRKKEK